MTETSTTEIQCTSPNAASSLRTFLFADVRGYTTFTQERGDEAAARLVAKFASIVREVAEARGGELLELRGDEALSVFGSARQALRAAVELQRLYARETEADPTLPLPVGIGIDTGEATSVEGGFRGEALNLAARLCALAGPGEILVSEGVAYLGRSLQNISYVERGTVPIKGLADPVRVIRVIGGRDGTTAPASPAQPGAKRRPPTVPIGGFLGALPSGELVGRELEWGRVVTSLEMVMQGNGQLVMLSGEPGIGKTRVAQEVTLMARQWGFLVATGRCYEQERTVPYYPFLEALATLYEACPPHIRAETPRRWPQLGRLLPELVGIAPPAPSPGDDQEDRHLLFRAITGFIEAIAETMPVAFLLDDLHWADDSSLKLLLYLARYTRGSRVLLVGTYRDAEIYLHHPLETALVDISRDRLMEEIEIRRLQPDGTAALVAGMLGIGENVDEIAAMIHRRTDGNAFFAQEMVRALLESGHLYERDGRWEYEALREMEIPKSVRALIGQRLARLSDQAQDILRAASVLGQRFTFDDLLATGQGWSEEGIEQALEQAVDFGLVREVDEGYAFNHSLTQAALYADLSTRRRKQTHLAAGEALERLSDEARNQRAGELARHFLEADDAGRALKYTVLAGDRAGQIFAHQEAVGHYRTALDLARELHDAALEMDVMERLAGSLALEARYDEALQLYEDLAQRFDGAADLEAQARVAAHIGDIHYWNDTAAEGVARLRPVIEKLEASQRLDLKGRRAALWAAQARLYVDTGQYREQLDAAERAVELSKDLGDDSLLLGCELIRSDALWRLDRHDEALRTMEELIPRAEAARDLYNLALALGYMASYHARQGEMDKDRAYRARMLAISEKRGDRGQIVLAELSLSSNWFTVGDWAEAEQHLGRAEAMVETLGTTRVAIWPLAARAWLSFRKGNCELATHCAQQVLSLTPGVGDLWWTRNMRRILAECDLVEGHDDQAYERLLPILEQHGWKRDVGFLVTLARVLAKQGKLDEARERSHLAVERAIEQGRQDGLVEALVTEGSVAIQQDKLLEAETLLSDALNHARG
ncbi:MAG: ATP-binding protein, partial [Chloroflexota bacterium]